MTLAMMIVAASGVKTKAAPCDDATTCRDALACVSVEERTRAGERDEARAKHDACRSLLERTTTALATTREQGTRDALAAVEAHAETQAALADALRRPPGWLAPVCIAAAVVGAVVGGYLLSPLGESATIGGAGGGALVLGGGCWGVAEAVR